MEKMGTKFGSTRRAKEFVLSGTKTAWSLSRLVCRHWRDNCLNDADVLCIELDVTYMQAVNNMVMGNFCAFNQLSKNLPILSHLWK